MALKLIPFDMAEELDGDEAITEYLSQVFSDGDSDEIVRALGHVARARGMAQLAKDSGLGRETFITRSSPEPRFVRSCVFAVRLG